MTDSKPSSPNRNVWIVGILFLLGIFLIPYIIKSLTRNIISIDFVDVSKSATEFKFPNTQQTYQSLLEEHCRDRIEHLEDGDTIVNGKFAAEAIVTKSATEFKNRDKSALKTECQMATTVPVRIPSIEGTSLLRTVNAIKVQKETLRTNGNSSPVAAALIIDAAEPGAGQPTLKFTELKDTIQNLVKDKTVLTIISTDSELKKDLYQNLADVPNLRICTFDNIHNCTDWAINTARNYKDKPSK